MNPSVDPVYECMTEAPELKVKQSHFPVDEQIIIGTRVTVGIGVERARVINERRYYLHIICDFLTERDTSRIAYVSDSGEKFFSGHGVFLPWTEFIAELMVFCSFANRECVHLTQYFCQFNQPFFRSNRVASKQDPVDPCRKIVTYLTNLFFWFR